MRNAIDALSPESIALIEHVLGRERRLRAVDERDDTETYSAAERASFEQAADRRAVLRLFSGPVCHTRLTMLEMAKLAQLTAERADVAVRALIARKRLKSFHNDDPRRAAIRQYGLAGSRSRRPASTGAEADSDVQRIDKIEGAPSELDSARSQHVRVKAMARAVVLRLLTEREELSIRDVAAALEGERTEKRAYQVALDALSALALEGAIVTEQKSMRGTRRLYRLARQTP